MRRRRRLSLCPDFWVGLLDHLLAEVHADQIVLENIVIEHVLGSFAEVDDPLGDRGRLHAERHILRISGAGGVVVAANTADAAGDEVGVARVFALHEDAVPAEDGRGAVTLDHMAVLEIDLGKDAQAAHDASDRVPVHLHQIPLLAGNILCRCGNSAHSIAPLDSRSLSGSLSGFISMIGRGIRWSVQRADAATSVLC